MRTMRLGGLAVLAALALLLAACGGKAKEPSGQPPASQAQSATAVRVAGSQLGKVVTDDKGRTLYALKSDQGGKSTCYGTCARTWPPLVAKGSPAGGDGLTASLLGTAARNDGGMQVTYKRRPLYYYSGDQRPGDTNGQGIGNVWFAVGADARLMTGTAGGGSGGGGGYGS